MDVLFKHFEEAKVCNLTSGFTYAYNSWQCQYAENAVLKNSINMGWIQLRKYYEKTDECPAYATALLLHPAYRAKYINTNWLEEWRPSAFELARIIWAEYKDRPIVSRFQSIQVSDRPPTKFDSLRRALKVTDHNEDEDELEKFLNGAPTPIFSTPLQWWTRDEQRAQYPRLYQMAIDILSIPPLSDKIEGVFSGVRRAIPWERGSLHMETVQIQELIGNWNKNGLLHEDEYVNELLMEAAAVVEKAEKRQDSEMGGGDEDELYSLL